MPRASIYAMFLAFFAFALVLPAPSTAQTETTVFGPQQYLRISGPGQIFTNTFQRCGTSGCQMIVLNGNANGTDRIVSGAAIYLNGKLIVGPNDFNQTVYEIVKPVTLAATNQLTVALSSAPGSFITVQIQCQASAASLSAQAPGVSLEDGTLYSAVRLVNDGTATAQNVQLTTISLPGGALTSPTLPFSVGTIPADSSTVLDADFSGSFAPLGSYLMTIAGTFVDSGATYCFSTSVTLDVPPAAPGSAVFNSVSVPTNSNIGPLFPTEPPTMDADVNTQARTVPTGSFVPLTPTATATSVMPAPFGDPPAIDFTVNTGVPLTPVPTNNTVTPAEPSGAEGGGVIFITANWSAAYSTDGGGTWTVVNPTNIFPSDSKDPIGFCCDQIVQFAPSIDRFIWLLQGSTGGYRLAVAKPEDIIAAGTSVASFKAAWTYWNITPSLFGPVNDPNGNPIAFDYPDMAVGSNKLYLSWDYGAGCNGCKTGLQVVRVSLADLQSGASSITYEFSTPSDSSTAWGGHLSQTPINEIFWAGHKDNSHLRVFNAFEGSNMYSWRDVEVAQWANNSPLTSNTPDNQNWVNFLFNPTTQNKNGGFPANAVIGATRASSQVWFAWSAGTDTNFTQPHIEMVAVDVDTFAKLQQVQIWNSNYAFAYPALNTNQCTGEIGLSFEFGGGGNYENHVVGFWGDFVAYITTGSNVGITRFGDYTTIRPAPRTAANPGNLFDAFGYGFNSAPVPLTNSHADIHWVQFGRPASSCNINPIQ